MSPVAEAPLKVTWEAPVNPVPVTVTVVPPVVGPLNGVTEETFGRPSFPETWGWMPGAVSPATTATMFAEGRCGVLSKNSLLKLVPP